MTHLMGCSVISGVGLEPDGARGVILRDRGIDADGRGDSLGEIDVGEGGGELVGGTDFGGGDGGGELYGGEDAGGEGELSSAFGDGGGGEFSGGFVDVGSGEFVGGLDDDGGGKLTGRVELGGGIELTSGVELGGGGDSGGEVFVQSYKCTKMRNKMRIKKKEK
ncbi:hypothetical protein L484_021323 [Morus notabilis]|uniref:Uncharacterized protein n=1 Tax=Morus notabilis TaxID=981085 RepID=W9S896_9ROSA|nr:hypothetical protein L484_021323 [Morus notabilis]